MSLNHEVDWLKDAATKSSLQHFRWMYAPLNITSSTITQRVSSNVFVKQDAASVHGACETVDFFVKKRQISLSLNWGLVTASTSLIQSTVRAELEFSSLPDNERSTLSTNSTSDSSMSGLDLSRMLLTLLSTNDIHDLLHAFMHISDPHLLFHWHKPHIYYGYHVLG